VGPETQLRRVTAARLAAVPGVVHGFERRRPGTPEERREGRARVTAALARYGSLRLMRQVHGRTVTSGPWNPPPFADAGVVEGPGQLIGVETADCLPVLLVDPDRRVAVAIHAGWRGTAARVVAEAVRAMAATGSDPRSLVAAIGPGIGVCCFEVGPELRAEFSAEEQAFFRAGSGGRLRLDLRGLNQGQLAAAGVAEDRIGHVRECTCCRPRDYFSYRRDGSGTGRMLNYVGWT
jgi:hypothetical protein